LFTFALHQKFHQQNGLFLN